MKKINKLILSFIFMFISIFGFRSVVLADETNQESEEKENYSIRVTAETGNAGCALDMTLEGFDKEQTIANDIDYFVKFVNKNPQKPVLTGSPYDSAEGVDNNVNSYIRVNVYKNDETNVYHSSIGIDDDWYMLDGYTTAYIIKCSSTDVCEVLDDPITVEKPALPKLTQRYQNFLFNDEFNSLSVFPYFPTNGETGNHEINVKIGLINDNELLKKISKNASGSYDELLKYAKTNDGTIFTENEDNFVKGIDIGDFEVLNGAYYYMYTYYTNTDSIYRNLDDITVVMGEADMLVNDVKWNFEDTEWDKFIYSFKNHKNVKTYEEEEITFYNDDSKFIITLNTEQSTFKTEFNYKDGIVSYVFDESKTEEDKFVDMYFNSIALEVFADMFSYKLDEFTKYLEKNQNLTIDKDGIEYETGMLYINEKNESVSLDMSGEYFKKLKFDIHNGLKTYKNKDNTVENPKTGISMQYGILTLLAILTGAVYVLIRKYSKFPKHN